MLPFIPTKQLLSAPQAARVQYLVQRRAYFMATMHPLPSVGAGKFSNLEFCPGYGYAVPGTMDIYVNWGTPCRLRTTRTKV